MAAANWSHWFESVNQTALARAESLLHSWLPNGHIEGREFRCGNLNGDGGKSFGVNLDTGRWADFAGTEAGGDLVSLYAALNNLKQGQAAVKLGRELGLEP